ncbi:hypothetical protein GF325_06030 [Candidatus Bathyarchaeota archaeon]|nr:hypothetical protein [Candidatus Bathyarchaeota archaeon]
MVKNKQLFSYYKSLEHGYQREYYIGEEAMQLRGVLKLQYPVEQERLVDKKSIERILFHAFFTRLGKDPWGGQVIFCPPWDYSPARRHEGISSNTDVGFPLKAYLSIFFSILNLRKVTVIHPALAILLGEAVDLDCIVVHIGDGVTMITPVVDGTVHLALSRKLPLGFRHIVDYMRRLLIRRGYKFQTSVEKLILADLCKKHGRVSPHPMNIYDGNQENVVPVSLKFMLPDGEILQIKDEHIHASEIFFNPLGTFGRESPSLPIMIHEVAEALVEDLGIVVSHVLPCGPGAFPGISARLENALNGGTADDHGESAFQVRAAISPDPAYIGTSLHASKPNFIESRCITKQAFLENPGEVSKEAFERSLKK